jgi:hypothetical protein
MKQSKMGISVTAERFVAFLDIMGFKDFVYRHNHAQVEDLMRRVAQATGEVEYWERYALRKRKAGSRKPVDMGTVLPVMFSDSILLVSRSNSVHDARKIVYAVSFLLYRLFTAGVPVKGALAHGLFTADFEHSVFFGKPLIDSYALGEESLFYGAVLHHTFDEYLHTHKVVFPKSLVKVNRLPMRGGSVTHSYVDWQNHLGTSDAVEKLAPRAVLNAFYRSVSGSARRYVDNSVGIYIKGGSPVAS